MADRTKDNSGDAPKRTARAFGLFDLAMLSKINRLLKPFGIRLKKRTRVHWGDQVEIIVDAAEQETKFRNVATKIMEGWYADVKANPPAAHRENDINKLVTLMKQELS